jgi:hypothetical protein
LISPVLRRGLPAVEQLELAAPVAHHAVQSWRASCALMEPVEHELRESDLVAGLPHRGELREAGDTRELGLHSAKGISGEGDRVSGREPGQDRA